jgi:hypothetical protein
LRTNAGNTATSHARRIGERPKVAHVGVQRLGAGHRQHDTPEREEGRQAAVGEELDGVGRRQRLQHRRVVGDPVQPRRREHGEPHQHDGAEDAPDDPRPVALHGEQPDQDRRGDRDDQMVHRRPDDLEALDRGQHRDRRRDDAVAEEQRRTDDPQPGEQEDGAGRQAAVRPQQQRDQRHDPALAVVVGAHDQRDVLDRDDDRDRPHDERDDAVDVGGRDRDGSCDVTRERRLQRVQGARPDVAEDDAERADRERQAAGRARAAQVARR